MSPIVAARGLYKFHAGADAPVLNDVSFAVEPGEFVCVMGPSGSGKTTLLHLLSGLDKPSGGTVELAGKDLAALPERERTILRRDTVGYVFQFFNLMPNLSVIENVTLPIAIRGEAPDGALGAARELLARLGLGGKERSFPHQLSGGEMQRASLARALCGGQPLLLCDEPTGNLAQQAGQEVMELLRTCRDEDGKSVLLVTHNPRDAAFADRVLFLVDGHLVEGAELRGPGLDVHRVHAALEELSI